MLFFNVAVFLFILVGTAGLVMSVVDIDRYNFGLYLCLLSAVSIFSCVGISVVKPEVFQNPEWVDRLIDQMNLAVRRSHRQPAINTTDMENLETAPCLPSFEIETSQQKTRDSDNVASDLSAKSAAGFLSPFVQSTSAVQKVTSKVGLIRSRSLPIKNCCACQNTAPMPSSAVSGKEGTTTRNHQKPDKHDIFVGEHCLAKSDHAFPLTEQEVSPPWKSSGGYFFGSTCCEIIVPCGSDTAATVSNSKTNISVKMICVKKEWVCGNPVHSTRNQLERRRSRSNEILGNRHIIKAWHSMFRRWNSEV